MKFVILLVLAAAPLARAEVIPTGNVALPYGDFQKLLEAGRVPAPKVPLESAILSTRFVVEAGSASASAAITFDVESFEAGLIPLIGTDVMVRRYEPEDVTLVAKDGFYQLLVHGAKRQRVTLHVAWKGLEKDAAISYRCSLRPSVISELKLRGVRDNAEVEVPGAQRDGETYRLAGGKDLLLVIRDHVEKRAGEVVQLPPVVTTSTSDMRLVRDGTFLNHSEWVVRHGAAFVLKLRAGKDSELVACLVNGKPVEPVLAGGLLEISLPEPEGETKLALSYTGKAAPMAPVRGDIAISLPATDLLVESITWQLRLPLGYVPIAVEGNTESVAGGSQNQIVLTKELCRGEAPSVRIFYQKPETTTKP